MKALILSALAGLIIAPAAHAGFESKSQGFSYEDGQYRLTGSGRICIYSVRGNRFYRGQVLLSDGGSRQGRYGKELRVYVFGADGPTELWAIARDLTCLSRKTLKNSEIDSIINK